MACILNIETSTDVCSVAVSQDGACIFSKEDHGGPNHSVMLGLYVDEAMSFADSHAIPFDAVAVSSGPGSYTGLRIGVSMAKGLCFGRDLKLLSVPTLQLLAVPLLLGKVPELPLDSLPDDALLLREVRPVGADVVDADTYRSYLDSHDVYFFGNGAAKCMSVIDHPRAHFIRGVEPLAKYMLPLAEKRFLNGQYEDVAYFEPFYLKAFVAKTPKKLL